MRGEPNAVLCVDTARGPGAHLPSPARLLPWSSRRVVARYPFVCIAGRVAICVLLLTGGDIRRCRGLQQNGICRNERKGASTQQGSVKHSATVVQGDWAGKLSRLLLWCWGPSNPFQAD